MIVDSKPEEWLQFINDSILEKSMLTKFSAHKTNELFYYLKDVLYFEENSFYIIKPNYYKNWHPAIARLDLMEITDQILSRNGGKH
jgi:arabinogalactan endo-1,4-beta-galactosidase